MRLIVAVAALASLLVSPATAPAEPTPNAHAACIGNSGEGSPQVHGFRDDISHFFQENFAKFGYINDEGQLVAFSSPGDWFRWFAQQENCAAQPIPIP
jgi:hypothetical protein